MENFIKTIILDDKEKGNSPRFRFPPEPNGYLHLGHAKAICLNFSLAREFGGTCHLRFDDTNPTAEDPKFYDAIKEDLTWLGCLDEEKDKKTTCFTSNYFDQLYIWAEKLIKEGNAYVCDCTAEEMAANRGAMNGKPGLPCKHRDRTPEENHLLFEEMRAGKHPTASKTLRAKIDLASANVNLRDPVMYRILHKPHHRTGDKWCIYPSYDWAHGQSDAIEHITYSICTLEFEPHRPLYEWFLEKIGIPQNERPRQIEFARLNLSHTMMSKRKLKDMIESGLVSGWDDPRMPTISGLRRRGFTPKAIFDFCESIGVSKTTSTIELALLEAAIRDDLNEWTPRMMVATEPVKLIIENYPDDGEDWLEAPNHPTDESMGTRKVPFTRELWIDAEDFMEEAPKKYFRLKPGNEVRLRYAYYVTCTGCKRDDKGKLLYVTGTYDPATKGGNDPGGRKVKGTIHWVSAKYSRPAELRTINTLFKTESPAGVEDYDPNSMIISPIAWLELPLATNAMEALVKKVRTGYQFERRGYYSLDLEDSTLDKLVFNRTVSLRDTWAKLAKKMGI